MTPMQVGDETEAGAAQNLAGEPARDNADNEDDQETITDKANPFLCMRTTILFRILPQEVPCRTECALPADPGGNWRFAWLCLSLCDVIM